MTEMLAASGDHQIPPFGCIANAMQFREPPAPYKRPLENIEITGEPGSRIFTLTEGSLEPKGEPIDGIETVYKEAYRLRRAIRENEPNSPEWEAEAINVYERPGWKVKLRAWSLCRSTPTHFVCSETFEAWDGERSIFSRSWEKKITRELV